MPQLGTKPAAPAHQHDAPTNLATWPGRGLTFSFYTGPPKVCSQPWKRLCSQGTCSSLLPDSGLRGDQRAGIPGSRNLRWVKFRFPFPSSPQPHPPPVGPQTARSWQGVCLGCPGCSVFVFLSTGPQKSESHSTDQAHGIQEEPMRVKENSHIDQPRRRMVQNQGMFAESWTCRGGKKQTGPA